MITRGNAEEVRITWKEGTNIDIINRKLEHEKLILQFIHDAGSKGIMIKELGEKVDKNLKDKTIWKKAAPHAHIKYIAKNFKNNLNCT